MMLAFALIAVLVGAGLVAAWPLITSQPLANGEDAAVYRAQLLEVDREEAIGLLSADDARMARTEIQRRLIAAPESKTLKEESGMTPADRNLIIAVAAILAIGSALIYGTVGKPNIPSTPHAGTSLSASDGGESGMQPNGSAANAPPVDEMIGRLEEKLKSDPKDVEGWRMLGWSKFRTDDYAGSAKAYAAALQLSPKDADTQSAYGEVLTRVASGRVTLEATNALKRALDLNPKDARARFLLGLKKDQDGNPKGALNDWIAMLKSANADDPWYEEVRGRALELSQTSGIDISDRLPPARASTAGLDRPLGPSQADVEAAGAMSPSDRQAMIEDMVAGLDMKLQKNPKDLAGWLRLIHARRVLGQDDEAQAALERAQRVFASNASARDQLASALNDPLSPSQN